MRARVPLVGGGEDVQDAKVQRWTDTHVLVHWETPEGAYNIWVTVDRVTRIRRSESSWQYVYDKYEAYGEDY
ncbi:hypothetical protein ART_0154 [Arthrobacter sp. PAMC 25486]|nr:hypothetical protein ART_0154 [Arthrobacter sp. PAMC 25486]